MLARRRREHVRCNAAVGLRGKPGAIDRRSVGKSRRPEKQHAQALIDFDVSGILRERGSIVGFRTCKIPALTPRNSPLVERRRVSGSKADRTVQRHDCRRRVFELAQTETQVIPSVREIWRGSGRSFVRRPRLLASIECQQDIAEIQPCMRISRRGPQRSLDQFHRSGALAEIMAQHPEEMQRIGIVGTTGQGLFVERPCLGESASLMSGHGLVYEPGTALGQAFHGGTQNS